MASTARPPSPTARGRPARAQADEDDADVLDAGEGEQALEVVLDDRVEDAEDGGDGAEPASRAAPHHGRAGRAASRGSTRSQAVDAELDHDARHQRRDVARRRRVRARQPHVQRDHAGLGARSRGRAGAAAATRAPGRQVRRRARPVGETCVLPVAAASRSMPASRTGQTDLAHDRVQPRGVDRLGVVAVVEHEEVGRQRHQLPGDAGTSSRWRPAARGSWPRRSRDRRARRAARRPRSRSRRWMPGWRLAPTRARKRPAEGIERQLEAAERDQPGDRQLGRRRRARRRRRPRGGQRRADGGEDEEEAGHQRRWPITSRMPARMATGVGGHPGMTASTGTTSATPPTTA